MNPSHNAGFTLVELLVTLAILALITGTLIAILYQVFEIPTLGNARLSVDGELRNAGLWLVRDANESASFTGTGGTCVPFSFDTGAERGLVYTYTLVGNTLQREESTTGRTQTVARHVDGLQCPAGTHSGAVAITLVAAQGEISAEATYTLTMRVD
ncbi:MAG: PulJ/GspJ family protein [Anaerolineae bacterium]